MEKLLIVKGVAGLGNRLITASAAIQYAKVMNRKVYIDWSDGFFEDTGVNAFYSLFEIRNDILTKELHIDENMTWLPKEARCYPLNFSIYDYFRVVQIKNRYVRKVIKMVNAHLKNKICTQFWESLSTGKRLSFGGEMKQTDEDVVVFADYVPEFDPQIMRESIIPAEHICRKIDAFIAEKGLGEDAVGIHIRNTDKKSNKAVEIFIEKLKNYIVENNLEKIYLATDDPKIEVLFRKKFGERLVLYPKFLPEVEKDGIHHFAKNTSDQALRKRMAEESVLDMFILSKMDILFYQKGSTFSEISKVYHLKKGKVFDWTTF